MAELTYAKTPSDLEEVADLVAKTFARQSYFDFFERRMRYQQMDPWFKPEHSRIIREDGRIVSHVSIIEKRVHFGPVVVPVAGIGDVCTHPGARGKGYARLLMEDALRYMREHGYPLSMLYGIPKFYHKFGYIEAVRDYRLTLMAPDLPEKPPQYTARPLRPEDLPAVMRLYRKNFSAHLLTVARNERYWQRITGQPDRFLVVENASGEIGAYAHLWDEYSRKFVVNEAATDGWESSVALLHAVLERAPRELCGRLEVRMPPQMRFIRHIRELGSEMTIRTYAEGEGQGMLALLGLVNLLSQIRPLLEERLAGSRFSGFSGRLVIQTESERVALEFREGKIRVQEMKLVDPVEPDLYAEARYLVRNLVGFWSIGDALQQGRISVSGAEARDVLEVLFPEEDPYMFFADYF